ncbi:MAG: branched-chain amino acid transaminase [Casimicrobiaceae bacterium]
MAHEAIPDYIYMDGAIVPYEQGTVHVLTTAFKFAATVYEGIRAYWSGSQLYVFRLREHLERLQDSAVVARMDVGRTPDEITQGMLELIRANKSREDLHIRVLAYVAAENGGLDSVGPVKVAIAAMPMGRYPGMKPGKEALDICVSHWRRISESSTPPRVKTTGNYMNSRLALLQARADGYDDCILLDGNGQLTEGPGYNIFVVKRGEVMTPPVTQSLLEGVTRDTIIGLLSSVHGISVRERGIDRTELYLADEAFFCGSGKEVQAIRSVDKHALRGGAPGPIAKSVAEAYSDVVRGRRVAIEGWLTPVYS